MFINDAFAATQAAAETSSLGVTLVQFALILLIFYFFIIRPQQKRVQAHSEMIKCLKVGDKVLMSCGIYGKIKKIKDNELVLEVAPNTEIVFDCTAVGSVITDTSGSPKNEKKNKK